MSSENTSGLSGVWGSSGTDVFVVGNGGTILHYTGLSTDTIQNSDCIAANIYGARSAEAQVLRIFRDEVISRTRLGTAIISLYYKTEPFNTKKDSV